MKRGTHRHPKMLALSKTIHRPIPACIGYLHLLWEATADYAPQGDIGRYSDEWIEASCMWNGKKGELIAALIACGWIDKPNSQDGERLSPVSKSILTVHDWFDHAEEYVRKKLNRANLPFLSIHKDTDKVTGQRQILSGKRQTTADFVRKTADNGSLPRLALPTPSLEREVEQPRVLTAASEEGARAQEQQQQQNGNGKSADQIATVAAMLRAYPESFHAQWDEPSPDTCSRILDSFHGDTDSVWEWLRATTRKRTTPGDGWGLLVTLARSANRKNGIGKVAQ